MRVRVCVCVCVCVCGKINRYHSILPYIIFNVFFLVNVKRRSSKVQPSLKANIFTLHLKIPFLHQVEQATSYGHNCGIVMYNVIIECDFSKQELGNYAEAYN